IIRRALGKALRLEPLREYELSVDKRALVVGGGISGMTSALSLANQGFEVYLVEKEKDLGGNARRISFTLEGQDVQKYLEKIISSVLKHPLIHVYTRAEVIDSSGYVGNFKTLVRQNGNLKEIKHGAIILATGADEYKPTEYLYGKHENVLTQLELEELIAKNSQKFSSPHVITMIQCVGCRNSERNYCSRICCSHAIKNAIKIKELNPQSDVYILFRDIRTYGFLEDYYRKASDMGVMFIRYEEDKSPHVEVSSDDEKKILTRIYDPILNSELEIESDLLVLSSAIIPSKERESLAKMFKVTLSPDGFFQEAHVKLRPVDFPAEGVYLCGICQYPKHIKESVSQAYGAAGRAATLLSQEKIIASGAVCDVDPDKCVACGACITCCTYGAISFKETEKGKRAVVNPILCKGDGLCNSKCPTSAIYLRHFTDTEIEGEMEALLLGNISWGEE
ncbi:MAG: CoB--CoM heterodisulfide reductase iron-sulfur subunit A family protein, partial [Desulfatiglandales bacterium]